MSRSRHRLRRFCYRRFGRRPDRGRPSPGSCRRTSASGQASVEAVAGTVALLLAGLVCFQLLATGYSATVADGAAAAGAVALVRGQPVDPAVRDALPGWARSRVSVIRLGESVRVRLRPPSPLTSISEELAISSTATARPK